MRLVLLTGLRNSQEKQCIFIWFDQNGTEFSILNCYLDGVYKMRKFPKYILLAALLQSKYTNGKSTQFAFKLSIQNARAALHHNRLFVGNFNFHEKGMDKRKTLQIKQFSNSLKDLKMNRQRNESLDTLAACFISRKIGFDCVPGLKEIYSPPVAPFENHCSEMMISNNMIKKDDMHILIEHIESEIEFHVHRKLSVYSVFYLCITCLNVLHIKAENTISIGFVLRQFDFKQPNIHINTSVRM